MIADGKTALGIEFGSTRIKVVLIDKDHHPIASGSHDWENRLENNIWTYTLEDIWSGLQDSYQNLVNDVKEKYDITLTKVGSIGFSAMMHGYMAFDKDGELLVPFRTWRNTMTEEASEKLTEAFSYHIPQRWSIAHLYQAILKEEEHVKDIDYLTTLAGYVHWKLTGEKVLGVGEASGMFPIDIETKDYNNSTIKTINPYLGDYYKYIMPIFKKNERSLVPFFEYLFSKIENINITEIENYNYEQLKKHVKRMQYPKTYKPYFETTVTANISNKMEEKIRNIYGLKQSKIIIEFLQNNHLTLRYTNDIEKAKSLTLLLKKTYNLNLTIK